jgi:mannose-6-phosphate isomerase-like protein (cupin superfamily)
VIKFTRNHFKIVRSIEWSDVVKKLAFDFDNSTVNFIADKPSIPPTFAMHSNFVPGSIRTAYDEVKNAENIIEMHVYASLGNSSSTYGRHKDVMDVLIVGAIGSVIYKFDDSPSFTVDPGDSIFIPKGVYHEPQIVEPRVTLSFSWEATPNNNNRIDS